MWSNVCYKELALQVFHLRGCCLIVMLVSTLHSLGSIEKYETDRFCALGIQSTKKTYQKQNKLCEYNYSLQAESESLQKRLKKDRSGITNEVFYCCSFLFLPSRKRKWI